MSLLSNGSGRISPILQVAIFTRSSARIHTGKHIFTQNWFILTHNIANSKDKNPWCEGSVALAAQKRERDNERRQQQREEKRKAKAESKAEAAKSDIAKPRLRKKTELPCGLEAWTSSTAAERTAMTNQGLRERADAIANYRVRLDTVMTEFEGK